MSLNFKVDHVRKSKLFHAGDQVSGIVTATGPIHDNNTTVEIRFKGKSQTLIKVHTGQSTVRYVDKVRFFSYSKILLRGPCHVDAGKTASWPFTFELPLTTEPENGNPDITYSKRLLYAKAAHPLPPSISVSGSKEGAQYKAFISYELRAELHRSAVFSRACKKKGALPVARRRPRGSDDPPDPRTSARVCSQSMRHSGARSANGQRTFLPAKRRPSSSFSLQARPNHSSKVRRFPSSFVSTSTRPSRPFLAPYPSSSC